VYTCVSCCSASTARMMRWLLVIVCLCVALSRSATGTLSKDDKKKPGSKEQQVQHNTCAFCNNIYRAHAHTVIHMNLFIKHLLDTL